MASSRTAFLGKIYTCQLDKSFNDKWVECLVIEGSEIVFAGSKSNAQNEKFINGETKIIELKENWMLMPGFQDAHIHPILAGAQILSCDIQDLSGLQEALDKIKKYATDHPEIQWIQGAGYEDIWLSIDSRKPRYILDSVVPDRPAVFRRYDGHACWVNSKAIEACGFTADTPNPEDGIIDKDPHTGEVTGFLHESAAKIAYEKVPTASIEKRMEALECGLSHMIKSGITAFQEALAKGKNIDAYKKYYADSNKKLPKASLSLGWVPGVTIDFLKKEREYSLHQTGINRLRMNTVKIFVDGVVESKTAYMHEPYECVYQQNEEHNNNNESIRPNSNPNSPTPTHQSGCCSSLHPCGMPNYTREELQYAFKGLHAEGFQIHCHCIGDRATTETLDAFENAINKCGNTGIRHHIAHLQLVKHQDIKRMKELGISANFQPYWCCNDREMTKSISVLGKQRHDWQYPIKTVLNQNIVTCFGSDWPVSTYIPLRIIQVAVTHKQIGHEDEQIWEPEELIDLETAVQCYTTGSAFVNYLDKESGSLEVGKKADLIILDQNIFEIEPTNIHKISVLLTMVDGVPIYSPANIL